MANADKIATLATILEEFPDFDGDALELEGFTAAPWHNDICPKYLHEISAAPDEAYLVLWTDFVDPEKREHMGPRLLLQYCPDGYCTEPAKEIEAETLDELAAELARIADSRGITFPTPPTFLDLCRVGLFVA